ncbi:MAG: FAD-dependent oxidoreductase, partial [Hyphomicrobiales bacterium]
MSAAYRSWGRTTPGGGRAVCLTDRRAPLPDMPGTSFLPYGNGRSYGDSCLNSDGVLLDCRGLDRVIAFDRSSGVLRCEAGMLLGDIARLVMPRGWFLPVTPGTRFVTLGGAIANDVHGKNHHREGSFGRHVRCLELLRSDGTRRVCSPGQNTGWFRATVAGAGLTGVITWAEIQLRSISTARIDQETIRFRGLDEFFALSRESSRDWEYTVAWVDSVASGGDFGRGLFMRGNHAPGPGPIDVPARRPRLSVPFQPPVSLLNRTTLGLFNAACYRRHRRRTRAAASFG